MQEVQQALAPATALASYTGGTPVDSAKWTAKAVAQIDVWFMNWMKSELTTRLEKTVGDATKAASDAAYKSGDFATSQVGEAEATQRSKRAARLAAAKEVAARKAWKEGAQAEQAAAQADIDRAQTLLKDYVEEIVPLARAEVDARNAVDAAQKVLDESEEAKAELGKDEDASDANNVVAATGAYAVLRAARAAEASIKAQQEFHDARAQWALDNLTPLADVYDAAEEKNNALAKEIEEAEARLAAAKAACKRAAFATAQERLSELEAFQK